MPRLERMPTALLLLAGLACATARHRSASMMNGLDARAIAIARPAPRIAPAVSTGIYRDGLARSLYSRCQMFPSDSELYDRRARACGASTAAVLGAARLLLEVEASAESLPLTFADHRLRWLDAPSPPHLCAP
jgi:hypothetical protein